MEMRVKWSLLCFALMAPLCTLAAEEDCVGMNCVKSSLSQEEDLPHPRLDPMEQSIRQEQLRAILHGEPEKKVEKRVEKKEEIKKPEAPKVAHKPVKKVAAPSRAKPDLGVDGNLPKYLAFVNRSELQADSELSIAGEQRTYDKLPGLHAGDRIEAVIDETLKVSANTPIPVVAEIMSGAFKGGLFLGEATLESDLKRIRIDFKHLRLKSNQTVSIVATARSSEGEYALEGDFSSSDTKFLVGQVITGTAAGFVGSTLDRPQPVAGPYYEAPGLANAGKDAVIGGLAQTAKHMGERALSAPEYTTLKGPIEIQVLVLQDPTQTGA